MQDWLLLHNCSPALSSVPVVSATPLHFLTEKLKENNEFSYPKRKDNLYVKKQD